MKLLKKESEVHIDHDNIKQEESSLQQNSFPVSQGSLYFIDKSCRKKRRKKCHSENYDQRKNFPTHLSQYLYEQSYLVNNDQITPLKRTNLHKILLKE